jgi:hypothetical protein
VGPWLGAVIITSIGIVLAYTLRTTVPPYAVLFGSFFLALLWLIPRVQVNKALIWNAACLFVTLAIGELYCGFKQTDATAAYPHLLHVTNGLGWAAKPGVFRAVKKYGFGLETVYDVTYSISHSGFRITPGGADGPTVFFFGDSITFGEGVNDNQTLPHEFSALSGMRAVNFGVDGYGPHHMLRMFELNIPRTVDQSTPRFVVYTAFSDHIRRAAGGAQWDQKGPLYEVAGDGVQYVGSFKDKSSKGVSKRAGSSLWQEMIEQSRIYGAIAPTPAYLPDSSDINVRENDRKRFLFIVEKTSLIVKEQYHCPFVVLLWDTRSRKSVTIEDMSWVEARLNEFGIPVLRLSRVVTDPNFRTWIIENDNHPDGRAYHYAARSLLNFLRRTTPEVLKRLS